MTKKSGIFAVVVALAIVLPFVGLLASHAAAGEHSTATTARSRTIAVLAASRGHQLVFTATVARRRRRTPPSAPTVFDAAPRTPRTSTTVLKRCSTATCTTRRSRHAGRRSARRLELRPTRSTRRTIPRLGLRSSRAPSALDGTGTATAVQPRGHAQSPGTFVRRGTSSPALTGINDPYPGESLRAVHSRQSRLRAWSNRHGPSDLRDATAAGVKPSGTVATVSTTATGSSSSPPTASASAQSDSDGLTVTYVGVGMCSLTASVMAGTIDGAAAASTSPQAFSVGQGDRNGHAATISNRPAARARHLLGVPASRASVQHERRRDEVDHFEYDNRVRRHQWPERDVFAGAGECALTGTCGNGSRFTFAAGRHCSELHRGTGGHPHHTDHHGRADERNLRCGASRQPSAPTAMAQSRSPQVLRRSALRAALVVSYVGIGTCSLNAQVAAGR